MWVPVQDFEGGQIMLLKSCLELEGKMHFCLFRYFLNHLRNPNWVELVKRINISTMTRSFPIFIFFVCYICCLFCCLFFCLFIFLFFGFFIFLFFCFGPVHLFFHSIFILTKSMLSKVLVCKCLIWDSSGKNKVSIPLYITQFPSHMYKA